MSNIPLAMAALIMSVIAPCSIAADHQTQTQSDTALVDHAIKDLRSALQSETMFIKVHAGEALIDLGYSEEVLHIFRQELAEHGDRPQYRIGIWRVLATASPTQPERDQFVAKIRTAYFTSSSPDRTHAIESLAQLQYECTFNEREELEKLVATSHDVGMAYCRWAVANSGDSQALERLTSLLEHNDARIRSSTAYALRHMSEKLTPVCIDKLTKAASIEQGPEAQVRMVSAACVATNNMAQRDKLKNTLLSHLVNASVRQKREVAAALATIGNQNDLLILKNHLEDCSADVRISICHAILRIDRRHRLRDLRESTSP